MSEIRVTNVLGENGNSPVNFTKGINMSGIVTATSFVPTVGQLSHRNIIVNGACNIAQRATSATSTSVRTVDRWGFQGNWPGSAMTQSQSNVASGTTPYQSGFRKAFKIANVNQTSTGASNYIEVFYKIEAQDIAKSGWNYTDPNSFITLSFWVKSSVAQTFYLYLMTRDGTQSTYAFSTGALTADTWTKIEQSVPGFSGLTFDDNEGSGLEIYIPTYMGTGLTDNSRSLNTWAAHDAAKHTPDYDASWWNASNATFEMTGMQLEVGSVATPFEHRSYADQLRRCQRYYVHFGSGYNTGARGGSGGSLALFNYHLPVPLRAAPTFTTNPGSLTGFNVRAYKYNGLSDSTNTPTLATNGYTLNSSFVYVQQNGHSIDDDRVASIQQSGTIALSAEL